MGVASKDEIDLPATLPAWKIELQDRYEESGSVEVVQEITKGVTGYIGFEDGVVTFSDDQGNINEVYPLHRVKRLKKQSEAIQVEGVEQ